jgi:hypothetical protein
MVPLNSLGQHQFVHPSIGFLQLLKLTPVLREMIVLLIVVGLYVEVDIAWSRK